MLEATSRAPVPEQNQEQTNQRQLYESRVQETGRFLNRETIGEEGFVLGHEDQPDPNIWNDVLQAHRDSEQGKAVAEPKTHIQSVEQQIPETGSEQTAMIIAHSEAVVGLRNNYTLVA